MALQPISTVLFSPEEPSKALLAVLMSFHKNQLDPISLNGVELVMIVDTQWSVWHISVLSWFQSAGSFENPPYELNCDQKKAFQCKHSPYMIIKKVMMSFAPILLTPKFLPLLWKTTICHFLWNSKYHFTTCGDVLTITLKLMTVECQ